MKLKTKFGAVLFAIALAGGTMIGCNQGGSTPTPTPVVTKYFVNLPAASQNYTIAGIESTGYEKGANVSFTVTLTNPNDYELKAVKYDSTELTAGADGKYTFAMPEKDVTLSVTVAQKVKYSLSYEGTLKKGFKATFALNYGTDPVPFSQFTLEAATGANLVAIDQTKKEVSFSGPGKVVLVAKKDNAEVARTEELTVADAAHGELIDDPLTVEEAIAEAHKLDITYNEKVDGQTVWTYHQSEIFYYIEGVVTQVKEISESNKNATVVLGGGFEVYRVRTSDDADLAKLKSIDVGSKLLVHSKIMDFGGKDTEKGKGTPETYSVSPDFASIESVDNTVPYSLSLSEAVAVVKPNADLAVTATVHPAAGNFQIEWESADVTKATVADGTIHGVAEGQTTVTAKIANSDIEKSVKVIVDERDLVFRQAELDEIVEGAGFYLGMESGKTAGKMLYATGEMNGFYLGTTENVGDAAEVKISTEGTEDYKYVLKVNNKPILAYTADGHYNIRLGEEDATENVAKFKLSAEDLSFSVKLPNKDTAQTGDVELTLGTTTYETMSYNETATKKANLFLYGESRELTDITLDKETASLKINERLQLTATPVPTAAKLDGAVWASSVPTVATVENGKVVALAQGETDITLTKGDVVGTCHVTVSNEYLHGTVLSDPLTPAEAATEGAKLARYGVTDITYYVKGVVTSFFKAEAPILDASAFEITNATWSDEQKLALVKGAVVVGHGKIFNGGGYYAFDKNSGINIDSVSNTSAGLIEISAPNNKFEVEEGNDLTLQASVYPEALGLLVTSWESSDEEVATVINGVVHGLKKGSTEITAKYGEITAKVTVNVAEAASATQVTVDKTMEQIKTANNWTVASGSGTQTCYTSFKLDDKITVSTDGEPNCGSYWEPAAGKDWRLYQNKGGNVKITAASGYVIKTVTFTFLVGNTGTLLDGETALVSGTPHDVNAASLNYVVGNSGSATNGQIKIIAISVTYDVAAQ